jgi:hypothetical protein
MLLVNPRRRRKGRARSRRRNPRRRRMSAKQLMYFGGGRRKRRRNPRALRRHRRARGHRRYRRNPIGVPSVRGISGQVMGAIPGAVGALGLDVLLGLLPIPPAWKAGTLGYVTKILGAVGLGMVAKTVVSGHTAAQLTQGALTVMFHGIMRDFVATNVQSVPLGMYLTPRIGVNGLGYYGSGWNPMQGMSAYLPDLSAGGAGGSMSTNSMETRSFSMGEY